MRLVSQGRSVDSPQAEQRRMAMGHRTGQAAASAPIASGEVSAHDFDPFQLRSPLSEG